MSDLQNIIMENHPTKENQIAILGYGVEGIALNEYFKKKGFKNITIFDENSSEPSFEHDICNLDKYDFVYRSPGIHKDHPELIKAKNAGVKVSSSTQLFFDNCPCPIVGVTGTKGKGTTSSLTYEILKEAGKDVYLGGNIGQSPLEFLDKLTTTSIVVLELSSFQLHDITKSPHIAIVLNTTSDHLDYHKDNEEYLSAKEGIVRYQTENDILIVNEDYPYKERYMALTKGKILKVSRKKQIENGSYVKDGEIFLVENGTTHLICKVDEVGLIGPHNQENIMPASVACHELNVPLSVIKKVAKTFMGLPHRLELIKKIDEVSYYNDSFSTTPETCMAAIQSFSSPIILIAGGSEKNSDYTEMGQAIANAENIKFVILMGKTADRIKKSIVKHGDSVQIITTDSYQKAFDLAHQKAEKGDTVLMSPASASFDMFQNYKHRGDTFRKWVESL
ncbi:UDP-N-acetylmuramoyl-L-alanine--D-glutamate ligase [bacterium]|nr:UDP-N-acetylmuramoyl-L-alanine--D-glutamate ligase [bacterium]